MQRHHWQLTFKQTREPENVSRILKETANWRKAGKSLLESFYKPFYGITVRACVLPNIFERPIQPTVSERFLASDMGWTHHGAEGHHKAVLIAPLEALLKTRRCAGSRQKGRSRFVEDTTFFHVHEICSTFLIMYCHVLFCLSDTVSSDEKRHHCKTGTSASIIHVVAGSLCLHSAANKYLAL